MGCASWTEHSDSEHDRKEIDWELWKNLKSKDKQFKFDIKGSR